MDRTPLQRLILSLFAVVSLSCSGAELPLDRIVLPPGFRIELLARVPNARGMALGADNVLFVGSAAAGQVHAVVLDRDYRARRIHRIATGLRMPVGVAYRDGSLYVSAVERILRYDAIEQRLDDPPQPGVVAGDLPRDGHHGWRFIAFGPDGRLHVAIGAPCNVCRVADPHATILSMRPDGRGRRIVARGIRNSVGFDWNPADGSLWFTDNGRDNLGDDLPADELNRVAQPGQHFGFPACHEGRLPDPEFGAGADCAAYAAPAAKLGAHVAAVGMRFYRGTMFPERYRNAVFIAEHGSWNRSRKAGYRVVVARIRGTDVVGVEPFAGGWLQGESSWGRPADVLVLPDGSLLVSDDLAGAIYRIDYNRR